MIDQFQAKYDLLQARLAFEGVAMKVFCTDRDFVWQDKIYAQGRSVRECTLKGMPLEYAMHVVALSKGKPRASNSSAGESAHNWGCAADFILAKPYGGWQRDEVTFPIWRAYGDIARGSGLEWGGDWKRKKGSRGIESLGWDLAHVQLPGWETYKPKSWQDLVSHARDEHTKNVIWSAKEAK